MEDRNKITAAGDCNDDSLILSSSEDALQKWITSPDYNPFKVPPDSDMFVLRDQERKRHLAQRKTARTLPVHEKHTHTSRINELTARTRRAVLKESKGDDALNDDFVKDWTLETTKDHPLGKESIVEYINRKREMFLVKYAISVKREEMRKLEKLAREEEQKLMVAEQCLEDDAVTFDLFLKENDKSSVEAIKQAEGETRNKIERVAAVKRLSNILRGIETEISKYEEQLAELKKYRDFVNQLTPAQHRKPTKQKERKKSAQSSATDVTKKTNSGRKSIVGKTPSSTNSGRSSTRKSVSKVTSKESEEAQSSSDDEEPTLYFKDPAQLLTLFHELEDQNLSLIQNGQDMEENIEEIKNQAKITRERLNKEVDFLSDQINLLESAAKREEEKIEDLQLKCEMFSFGEFDEDDQAKLLKQFDSHVGRVYVNVIGDNEAQIPTLHMLISIENYLGNLLDQMEVLPAEVIAQYEKRFEKDRRARMREEKAKQQEMLQKERVQRALERAQAAPKTQIGRRPIRRSEPPRIKARARQTTEQLTMEQQEYRFYFEY